MRGRSGGLQYWPACGRGVGRYSRSYVQGRNDGYAVVVYLWLCGRVVQPVVCLSLESLVSFLYVR